jgi:hypothetical protein
MDIYDRDYSKKYKRIKEARASKWCAFLLKKIKS